MSLLKIGGVDMPTPSALTVHVEDVHFSLRHALDGTANVSRVGTHRVLSCQWSCLTGSELALLLGSALENTVLLLSFPDPVNGQTQTMNACCTERTMGLSRVRQGTLYWTQVRLTFTEV